MIRPISAASVPFSTGNFKNPCASSFSARSASVAQVRVGNQEDWILSQRLRGADFLGQFPGLDCTDAQIDHEQRRITVQRFYQCVGEAVGHDRLVPKLLDGLHDGAHASIAGVRYEYPCGISSPIYFCRIIQMLEQRISRGFIIQMVLESVRM
jgi:hypothetical protein